MAGILSDSSPSYGAIESCLPAVTKPLSHGISAAGAAMYRVTLKELLARAAPAAGHGTLAISAAANIAADIPPSPRAVEPVVPQADAREIAPEMVTSTDLGPISPFAKRW
jgi:hypothetical protein